MNGKRSLYNILVGVGSQVLSIALGVIIPRLFLLSFGSEMNGFLSSITQIIAYFTLLEAGVGAATLQALYKPVSSDDKKSISAIVAATDRYYRKTGFAYLLCVVVLSVGYPLLVHSDIPLYTMVLIILFNGIPGVVGYYFQGKYIILLQAEGKTYINTALTSISSTLISVLKVIMLLLGCDILLIQFTYLVINLIKILAINIYIKRHYKWLDKDIKPDFDAIGQKNAAFVNQICDLVFRNTDTIILTIFCDLKIVSVYAMYTLLFSMVRTALDYIAQGFNFIMGQTFNQDIEKYTRLHDLYETYRMALVFTLYSVALIFILPFMALYTSGINDVNYLDHGVAVLFTVFYLMTGARACASDLINYAQHFRKTQSRCIAEAAINLVVSIVAVNFVGIYGVLIGTIVALTYRMNDMLIYANRRILGRSPWRSYKRLLVNAVLFLVVICVANQLPWQLDSYVKIIGWGCVAGAVIGAVYFVAASLTNPDSFFMLTRYVRERIRGVLERRA